MDRFRVEVLSQTQSPQQVMYAAMHQDYTGEFVFNGRDSWPSESQCGEIIVKRLLAGERGHYGPLEHVQIVLNCGYFPHSVMQQARTHRVGLCLTGDVKVNFTPDSLSPGEGYYQSSIGELAMLWHHGRNPQKTQADAEAMKREISNRNILILDTASNRLTASHITDIYVNGVKEVYEIKTATGESIKATKDHLFWTNQGWLKVADFNYNTQLCRIAFLSQETVPTEVIDSPLELAGEQWNTIQNYSYQNYSYSETSTRGRVRSFANDLKLEAKPIPGNHYSNRFINLQSNQSEEKRADYIKNNTVNCNRGEFVDILSVEYSGLEPTYDLEIEHQAHNFIANNLVVHNSFDVQSFRYTGQQFIEVLDGKKDIEEVFYLRPVGDYRDRQGKSYYYSPQQREADLKWCLDAIQRYQQDMEAGLSEEHARGKLPFDYRQHFVVSFNLRALLHFLDLRYKKDAQLEIQKLCDLILPHLEAWVPDVAQWYKTTRLGKARLSP